MRQIERSIEIHASFRDTFDFVTDVRNHGRVVPADTHEELVDAGDIPLKLGTAVRFKARYGGIAWSLASRISAFEPPNADSPAAAYFRDEQIEGPFKTWVHDHLLTAVGPKCTRLTDRFTYAAPYGQLGRFVERCWLNRRLVGLLEHMHAETKRLLEQPEVLQQ